MNTVQYIQYNICEMNAICPHRASLRFCGESFDRCHNGKVTFPNLHKYPPELKRLFDINDHKGTNFRKSSETTILHLLLLHLVQISTLLQGRGLIVFTFMAKLFSMRAACTHEIMMLGNTGSYISLMLKTQYKLD